MITEFQMFSAAITLSRTNKMVETLLCHEGIANVQFYPEMIRLNLKVLGNEMLTSVQGFTKFMVSIVIIFFYKRKYFFARMAW